MHVFTDLPMVIYNHFNCCRGAASISYLHISSPEAIFPFYSDWVETEQQHDNKDIPSASSERRNVTDFDVFSDGQINLL